MGLFGRRKTADGTPPARRRREPGLLAGRFPEGTDHAGKELRYYPSTGLWETVPASTPGSGFFYLWVVHEMSSGRLESTPEWRKFAYQAAQARQAGSTPPQPPREFGLPEPAAETQSAILPAADDTPQAEGLPYPGVSYEDWGDAAPAEPSAATAPEGVLPEALPVRNLPATAHALPGEGHASPVPEDDASPGWATEIGRERPTVTAVHDLASLGMGQPEAAEGGTTEAEAALLAARTAAVPLAEPQPWDPPTAVPGR